MILVLKLFWLCYVIVVCRWFPENQRWPTFFCNLVPTINQTTMWPFRKTSTVKIVTNLTDQKGAKHNNKTNNFQLQTKEFSSQTTNIFPICGIIWHNTGNIGWIINIMVGDTRVVRSIINTQIIVSNLRIVCSEYFFLWGNTALFMMKIRKVENIVGIWIYFFKIIKSMYL